MAMTEVMAERRNMTYSASPPLYVPWIYSNHVWQTYSTAVAFAHVMGDTNLRPSLQFSTPSKRAQSSHTTSKELEKTINCSPYGNIHAQPHVRWHVVGAPITMMPMVTVLVRHGLTC